MKKTNLFSSLFSYKRTKKKYKRKERRSRKSLKGGASAVAAASGQYSTFLTNPDDVFKIQPGEQFKFFGYEIKFYDFSKMSSSNVSAHKEKLKQIKNLKAACHGTIGQIYFENAVDDAHFAITLTFEDKEGIEHYDSFILGYPLKESKTDFYTLLTCSRIIKSQKKKEEDIASPSVKKSEPGIISPSFGLVLQCIMLKYARKLGFTHAYNDSVPDLLSYYTRFGFRLGLGKCGTPDAITDQHELVIKEKDDEKAKEFYGKMLVNNEYKTGAGFRMKLCDLDKGATNICEYAHKKLSDSWKYLEKYDDIYNGPIMSKRPRPFAGSPFSPMVRSTRPLQAQTESEADQPHPSIVQSVKPTPSVSRSKSKSK